MISFTVDDFKKMKRMGEILGKEILKTAIKKALVIGLVGQLGTGKTTFVQGLARGLSIKQRIISPSFVIIRKYKFPRKSRFSYFYHIDCYRILTPKEMLELDFKKILEENSVIAIEWAEKIKKILPGHTLWMNFDYIDKNKRKVTIIYE